MHRKLQYNSKKHIFVCFTFTLLTLFTVITHGALGEISGVCRSTSVNNINIATINVYASNDTTEQSVVDGMFVLTRTGDLSSQLTVPFILSGTAENSLDFIPVAESVHFDVGESEKSVYITPINDAEIEQNETVTLVLSLGVGYILGDHISDTIILSDDETGYITPVQMFPSQDRASKQANSNHAETLAISDAGQVDLSLEELSVGSASEPVNTLCTTKTKTGGHCDIDNTNQLSAVELDGQRNIISMNANIASIDATQSIKFSGGGSSCRMNTIQWQEPAHNQMLPNPPVDAEYLSGFYFVEYEISACTPGSTLSFTLSYQVVIPADAVLMQYGPTPEDASNHWFEIRTSEIGENTVTYTVTDGQSGDYDLSVNGSITNPIVLLARRLVQAAAPVLALPEISKLD